MLSVKDEESFILWKWIKINLKKNKHLAFFKTPQRRTLSEKIIPAHDANIFFGGGGYLGEWSSSWIQDAFQIETIKYFHRDYNNSFRENNNLESNKLTIMNGVKDVIIKVVWWLEILNTVRFNFRFIDYFPTISTKTIVFIYTESTWIWACFF